MSGENGENDRPSVPPVPSPLCNPPKDTAEPINLPAKRRGGRGGKGESVERGGGGRGRFPEMEPAGL